MFLAFAGHIRRRIRRQASARPVVHQLVPHGIEHGESCCKRKPQ